MELKVRRKIVNKHGDSGMVSIPPLFLENMGALGCRDVILTVPDRDHILIEVIRNE
jgi:putative transposon-encoded protein